MSVESWECEELSQAIATIDANWLHDICEARIPAVWPVAEIKDTLHSPSSEIGELLNAGVMSVTCYNGEDSMRRVSLLICLRPGDVLGISSDFIWARCERRPRRTERRNTRRSTDADRLAMDTFQFSSEPTRLLEADETAIMECSFTDDTLKLLHILDLLDSMNSIAPTYSSFSNAWWFASLAFGTLQIFRDVRTIRPNAYWVMSATKALSGKAERASSEVTRKFVGKWSAKPLAHFPLITSPEAWGHGHITSNSYPLASPVSGHESPDTLSRVDTPESYISSGSRQSFSSSTTYYSSPGPVRSGKIIGEASDKRHTEVAAESDYTFYNSGEHIPGYFYHSHAHRSPVLSTLAEELQSSGPPMEFFDPNESKQATEYDHYFGYDSVMD